MDDYKVCQIRNLIRAKMKSVEKFVLVPFNQFNGNNERSETNQEVLSVDTILLLIPQKLHHKVLLFFSLYCLDVTLSIFKVTSDVL